MSAKSGSAAKSAKDFDRIEKAIQYIESRFRDQPALREVAAEVGLSEYHFQRLFRRWVGISPKRFLQYLTAEYARKALAKTRSVLDAAYDAGLSSMGRLHDLMVSILAMTPGEVKEKGRGLTLRYGFHESPFGELFLCLTDRGICSLAFPGREDRSTLVNGLADQWPKAALRNDPQATRAVADRVFEPTAERGDPSPLILHVKGTNFQVRVWEALLRLPQGGMCTYGDIARVVGAPTAAQAVGQAVGSNPVAYLIPCHRVIKKTGAFGGYRWGVSRKQALLAWEAARC